MSLGEFLTFGDLTKNDRIAFMQSFDQNVLVWKLAIWVQYMWAEMFSERHVDAGHYTAQYV